MPHPSVFIFDSSYMSVDVALPIDDSKPHLIVSDREIEPPPGHSSLQIEEQISVWTVHRNLQLLRSAWHRAGGGKCIVVATPGVRREQLLLNTFFALSLCRNVLFFDGSSFRSLKQSWRLILGSVVRVLGKRAIGRLKTWFERAKFHCCTRFHRDAATAEGRLFGHYARTRSFSLPFDTVVRGPNRPSIYGEYTRAWYLPKLSNCRQRYTVQTKRHRLHDIILHVEDLNGSAERLLFKDSLILDYPYLLGKTRRNFGYFVATRGEVKSIERGIDLLHFTSGYYHWLLEGIPRVLDLIDDGIDFDQYPLIMPPLEPFHRQILEVLGISAESQVVIVDKGDWCNVRECIVPTSYFPFAAPELDDPSGQPDGSLLRRICERLLERLPKPSAGNTSTSKRLYISRARATRRKLTIPSEATVRSILESAGFQTVFLEDLSWAEQVRMVSGAEVIVGLHGAGLANVLFAKAQLLIEFHNPLETRSHFALMARELNMNYAYLIGILEGHSNDYDNIVINPEALKDVLHRLNLL